MDMSRRSFLRHASLGAAAAGAAATVGPSLLGMAGSAAPEVTTVVDDTGADAVEGPLVAHVVDASKGTVAVYHGAQEVIVQSPSLVRALTAAVR